MPCMRVPRSPVVASCNEDAYLPPRSASWTAAVATPLHGGPPVISDATRGSAVRDTRRGGARVRDFATRRARRASTPCYEDQVSVTQAGGFAALGVSSCPPEKRTLRITFQPP